MVFLKYIYIFNKLKTRGFSTLSIVYTMDEGVQKKWFNFLFRFRKCVLKSIRSLSGWNRKDCKVIYKLWRKRIMKQNESDGDLEFIATIRFGSKYPRNWKKNKRQFWKWKIVTKTPYQNRMLDKQVLRAKERPEGHMLFLPQEVVTREIQINGLQKRHNYKQRSPRKKM